MDLPTRLDLFAIGRDYAVQRAKKLDPKQVDIVGSEVNLFVGGGSVIAYSVVKQIGYQAGALLLDSSFGEDLDRLAWDRYQELRKGASPAIGGARIYRANNSGGDGTVDIGTACLTLSGAEYITTSKATFTGGALSALCDIRATQAGKDAQVGQNQVRRFRDASALFDPTLQITNDQATAGGEEREEDDDFKNRLRTYWITAQKGILSAITRGALSVPGIASAQATEGLDGTGAPARVVALYIADSSGVASKQLAKKVYTKLDDYRGAGIPVILYTSIPQLVGIVLSLKFQASVDTDVLSDLIRVAIVAYVNSLGANQPLTKGALGAVLERYRADGLLPDDQTIVSPDGDLVPNAGRTIRTNITLVVVQ